MIKNRVTQISPMALWVELTAGRLRRLPHAGCKVPTFRCHKLDPESPIALKEYSLIHNMNPLNNLGYVLSLYLRGIGLSGELDCVMDPCPPDQHESTLETQEAM